MADETRTPEELTDDDLAKDGEALPPREAMSIIAPDGATGIPIGRIPDEALPPADLQDPYV